MYLKKKLLYLLALTLTITVFVSCAPASPTVQTPNQTVNSPSASSLIEPSLSTSETTAPADPSPTQTPYTQAFLTFDEARKICSSWLENHDDVPSHTFHEWVYDPYEIPPPTYFLFGEPYYEFPVSNSWAGASGFSHLILVQAKTGELLSLYKWGTDQKHLMTTIELLDDWYSGEPAISAPASLTSDEAISIYNAWLYEHSDNQGYSGEYSIDAQANDTYVLFGEQYYRFHAKDDQKYWYNILVNMETGKLLFMMITDGMFSETSIELLDEWYNRTHEH